MKKALVIIFFIAFAGNSHALLIDNGVFTTDTDTGLQWADFTATVGVSYNDALNASSSYDGGGWRYATNTEVENLFGILFEGFVATHSSGFSDSRTGSAYADQAADMINFFNLFGSIYVSPNYISYGLYMDEDGILRMMGAWAEQYRYTGVVYGPELLSVYDPNVIHANYVGSYIVRDTAPVPEPGSLTLLGIGLLGLVISRGRKYQTRDK